MIITGRILLPVHTYGCAGSRPYSLGFPPGGLSARTRYPRNFVHDKKSTYPRSRARWGLREEGKNTTLSHHKNTGFTLIVKTNTWWCSHFVKQWYTFSLSPLRTGVPSGGQSTQELSGLSPRRDCGSKRVRPVFVGGISSKGRSYRRAFSSQILHFFRAISQSSICSWFFFPNVWNLWNLIFCCFWRITRVTRVVTERLRISIHISNYFQALEMTEKHALR